MNVLGGTVYYVNVLGGTVYYVNVLGGILCECIGRYTM